MMLPFRFLPCSSAEHHIVAATVARSATAERDLTGVTSSDPPSSTSSADAATNNSDDSSSTSLLSLHSLLIPLSSPITPSHLFLTSLKPLALSSSSSAPALAVAAGDGASRPPLLYSASEAGITVFNLAVLRTVETLPGIPSSGSVKSLAVSADGSAFFTAHQDGRIRVWRRSTRSDRHSLAAVLPTSSDRLLRLPLPDNYVTIRRHRRRLWIEHADAVSSLAISSSDDGSPILYSGSWDRTLKTWRADRGHRCLESVRAHGDAVNAVAAAGDGIVYTGSADGKIRVWVRPETQQGDGANVLPFRRQRRRGGLAVVAELAGHRSAVNALALNVDGSVLYSGGGDRTIVVWEREESASHMVVVKVLRGHSRAVLCLACTSDLVLSGSADRTVRIWRRNGSDGTGFSCLCVMDGHLSRVRSVAAVPVPTSPKSNKEFRVCTGSMDGEVRVWRVRVSGTKDGSNVSFTGKVDAYN